MTANTGVRPIRTTNAVLENLQLENDGLGIRIANGVDVPAHSTEAPLDVMIWADDLPAFRPGDQVTGTEIAALGGDTLGRLTAAVDAYLRAHPADYPGFGTIVEIRWAKRVVVGS